MKKTTSILIVLMIFLAAACTQQQQPAQTKTCPASCDDANYCTSDQCSPNTDFNCIHTDITPCCGNSKCEAGENPESCSNDCLTQNTSKIAFLIENNAKLAGYKYTYEDEATTYNAAVSTKNNLIKISYKDTQKTGARSYDTILINKTAKTAYAYCETVCDSELPAIEMSYSSVMIKTPVERLKEIALNDITILPNSENVEGNKPSTVFTYQLGGKTTRMKAWTLYGLLLVEETVDDSGAATTIAAYKGMTNIVRDSEFALPEGTVLPS